MRDKHSKKGKYVLTEITEEEYRKMDKKMMMDMLMPQKCTCIDCRKHNMVIFDIESISTDIEVTSDEDDPEFVLDYAQLFLLLAMLLRSPITQQ